MPSKGNGGYPGDKRGGKKEKKEIDSHSHLQDSDSNANAKVLSKLDITW
jgi:hypothetical protein